MVGLVIVSHSRTLAEAVVALTRGIGEREIPIASSGGVGADGVELGTDATDVMQAIRSVDSPEGVLVLADLGSAILSAETAIDLLGSELSGPVRIVSAPLVEGSVSATVQIGLDSDLDTVAREAMCSLRPKQQHLGSGGPGIDEASPLSESSDEWLVDRFRVRTQHGLHARPAARLVRTVNRYATRAEIRNPGRETPWVNACSMNRVAMLQIRTGDEFEIRFSGRGSEEALDAVAALVEENFGESHYLRDRPEQRASTKRSPIEVPVAQHEVLHGSPAAPGLAIGPVFPLVPPHPVFSEVPSDEGDDPVRRTESLATRRVRSDLSPLREATDRVTADLRREAETAHKAGRSEAGEIIDAHALLIADPYLMHATGEIYRTYRIDPVEAFWRAAEELSREYRAMEDPYMRARAIDLLDVAVRLVEQVAPERVSRSSPPDVPSILVTEELSPAQAMYLDTERVLGVVTVSEQSSSHAAIIAQGIGIPMVTTVALPSGWRKQFRDLEVVVDGTVGTVEIAPSEERRNDVAAQLRVKNREEERVRAAAREPARMIDGTTIPVFANIATVADARHAAANGADGVGLLRTEFIFLGRDTLPDEETQLVAFQEMTAPFPDKPVTVRLLDIGGDKEVSTLLAREEANPFLGVRGVRLLLRPECEKLLETHLRAVLRLAFDRSVQVMIPMVALVEEIRAIRSRLILAREALRREGVPHGWPVELGIMVETPAAVFLSDRMARISDFFSIGTNDLTQYVMAAERGNGELTALYDGLHPAVLRAFRRTILGADAVGIPVGVCGELGSDGKALPILLGLGVQQLSVNASAVGAVKEQVRGLALAECRGHAELVLQADVAGSVRYGGP